MPQTRPGFARQTTDGAVSLQSMDKAGTPKSKLGEEPQLASDEKNDAIVGNNELPSYDGEEDKIHGREHVSTAEDLGEHEQALLNTTADKLMNQSNPSHPRGG